jgi:ABC-2 type transport system permease protein
MRSHWRTLRWSTWLGWQIEANWASPWLFVLYVLVKPLAGSLLLVCMYWAARSARGASIPSSFLPFLYISSACFMLVGGVTFGMCNAVVSDRESFGMLKFVWISPARFRSFLLGRGLSKAAQASIGACMTVLVGLVLFPELRAALGDHALAWGWLLYFLTVGLVMIVALGLILAGMVLNMSRYGTFLSEGVAGMLYLLCGAVFPIDVLPPWLQPFSLLLPPTYWLEGMRRTLLGYTDDTGPLGAWGQGQLALALGLSTLLLALFAHYFFRWSEHRAWTLGRLDETSGF